jgi:hypothetical protein
VFLGIPFQFECEIKNICIKDLFKVPSSRVNWSEKNKSKMYPTNACKLNSFKTLIISSSKSEIGNDLYVIIAEYAENTKSIKTKTNLKSV